MYKVMYNNTVIDVLKSINYGKYIPATKRVVATSKVSANCIVASNLTDRYLLKGVPVPEGCPYLQVSVVPIDADEYQSLIEKDLLPTESGIRRMRENKIAELKLQCDANIVQGFQVELSDRKLHHFALSIEDQLNLLEIRDLIASGEISFIFHESGGEYIEFSVEDMKSIIREAFNHKQRQLVRFNQLKKYVNQLDNVDKISKVSYDTYLG